ncbi:IscS subfamily cysteine desulfurase [Pseudomonadota bacterium]
MSVKTPIYMDYQATTPLDKRVLEVMMPLLTKDFGNPHSSSHSFGWIANKYVEEAREKTAKVINADAKDIIFTSGATESNNLAIKGVANFYKDKKNHIITVRTEHKCVLETCRFLERQGFKVTYLTVQENGIIDLDDLRKAMTDKTSLVSVMAANNEIGVLQPIKEIGKICRENNVFFHTDAAQAFGKIPLNVNEMNIDLMSISGHKIYGPKGVGVLYVRRKPRVRLEPLFHGGGQERGFRSGTVAPYLVYGLGVAGEIANHEMKAENKRLWELNELFYNEIMKIEQVYLNGDRKRRVPNNLNLSFTGIEGESLMMGIKEIAVSSGSACTSESLEPSYVLNAINIDIELAHSSIRFSFGRFTTKEEVLYVTKRIAEEVKRLREMSPVWENSLIVTNIV